MEIRTTDKSYIVTTVRKDLEYLMKEWTPDIDDDSIRIGSVILRRLLVENTLSKAWRLAGFDKEPSIEAYSLGHILTIYGAHRISFAQAGGAKVKGGQVGDIHAIQGPQTPEELELLGEKWPIEEYSLNKFVESVCIVIEGNCVKRRELIKYVSNKLGGVHLDVKRPTMESIKRHKLERAFVALDNVYESRNIFEKNAIFYELLSIGQDLINSDDVKMFVEKTKLLVCGKKESYFEKTGLVRQIFRKIFSS